MLLLILILTSFVLQWCFSLIHQHLQKNKRVNNAVTAVFLYDMPSTNSQRMWPKVLTVSLDSFRMTHAVITL